jgi:hypothetical protein
MSRLYHRTPMIFRLQFVALNSWPVWHFPFHRAGTGLNPSSLKLRDSGHMPVVKELYAYAWCQLLSNNLVSHIFFFELELGLQTCIEHSDDYIFTGFCFLKEARLLWWLVVVKAKEVPAPSRV